MIRIGDNVRLESKPDGSSAQHYPLTVGNTYERLGLDGSNIITTTDEPGSTASYWRGRVSKVTAAQPLSRRGHGPG